MNDIEITFHGNAGDSPRFWDTRSRPFARLNVACTPRIRQDGEWTDGPTQWFQVKAWGKLAENMTASVRKGDAVIITGNLRMEEYTNEDGVTYKTAVVLATGVGFDLRRSRAQALAVRNEAPPEGAEAGETAGPGDGGDGGGDDAAMREPAFSSTTPGAPF